MEFDSKNCGYEYDSGNVIHVEHIGMNGPNAFEAGIIKWIEESYNKTVYRIYYIPKLKENYGGSKVFVDNYNDIYKATEALDNLIKEKRKEYISLGER